MRPDRVVEGLGPASPLRPERDGDGDGDEDEDLPDPGQPVVP